MITIRFEMKSFIMIKAESIKHSTTLSQI